MRQELIRLPNQHTAMCLGIEVPSAAEHNQEDHHSTLNMACMGEESAALAACSDQRRASPTPLPYVFGDLPRFTWCHRHPNPVVAYKYTGTQCGTHGVRSCMSCVANHQVVYHPTYTSQGVEPKAAS